MDATYEMKMAELIKNITCEITLTGVITSRVRLVLGVLLFRFAAWVTGTEGRIMIGNSVLGEIK